jgi:hypothetical protein
MRIPSTLLFILAIGLFGSTSISAQTAAPAKAGAAAAATNVGSEKCKVCHKVQYDSWLKSEHAEEKKADCETCHGPGSGYIALAVMKDPAKAKAAGLIAKPDKASCATCHKKGVKDEDLVKVHAHKAVKPLK